MGTVFLYVLALIIPLFFLGIIRKFDFYQTGQFLYILLCIAWGAIVYAPAALANWSVINLWSISKSTVEHFIAPVLEELLKGLILIYLVRRSKFTYSVDGALYGFATGIGFAIFENFENIPDTDLIISILSRIFSTNLVHAFSSASIGITLGMYRSKTSRWQWYIPIIGWAIAIGQHMIFNFLIGKEEILPAFFFIPIIPGILFIYYIMHLGRGHARVWIKDQLEKDNRITYGEASAVYNLASPNDVLLPIVERFGIKKAELMEKLLYLQARLGIKRKALIDIRENDAVYPELQAEINEMYTDIEKIQREIGTYAMLFVRGLFTDEMISVWEQVQAKIQERSAATDGEKGGGLWSLLDDRVKSSAEDKGSD